MSARSNHGFFQPSQQTALVPTGATNLYIVAKATIRIIPTADTYIKFTNDPTEPIPTSANILLKANVEYFVASGDNKFMVASTSTSNVVPVEKIS